MSVRNGAFLVGGSPVSPLGISPSILGEVTDIGPEV